MDSLSLKILPWNGHKAALSLTFDDGVPAHWEIAAPALERRGLRGTFFVVAGRSQDQQGWKRLVEGGHEVANHSISHKRTKDLGPGEDVRQVAEAKAALERILKVPIHTFAYPFTETTPGLKEAAQAHHFLSRGGQGRYYWAPQEDPDWSEVPSQVAMSSFPLSTYEKWVQETYRQESWTIFQLHGIEGGGEGWQPMPRAVFDGLLDLIASQKDKIWVAPFAEVGAYWKAQKIIEKALADAFPGRPIAWKRPDPFPAGVILKALWKGSPLSVPFDTGALPLGLL
ncbi:MAG TPA: polysaccharide deacetylase family protein [bacterium]|nr:polysaccharide deacetylase family protein [bacterium]